MPCLDRLALPSAWGSLHIKCHGWGDDMLTSLYEILVPFKSNAISSGKKCFKFQVIHDQHPFCGLPLVAVLDHPGMKMSVKQVPNFCRAAFHMRAWSPQQIQDCAPGHYQRNHSVAVEALCQTTVIFHVKRVPSTTWNWIATATFDFNLGTFGVCKACLINIIILCLSRNILNSLFSFCGIKFSTAESLGLKL